MPIPALPLFKHRDTVITPADQNQFVTQFENTMDTLSKDVIPAMNTSISNINTQYNNIYNNLPFEPDSGYSQAYINNTFVKLTGNQTVADVKTFTSSPIVPVPTTNTQAVNKAYADTKQANLGFTPVQQGTGIGQIDNVVKIGWSGTRTKIMIDETDMGNIVMDDNIGVANSSLVKTALNASGEAPIYACRAWVNFNGTGTVAIRASGNVSSITDNGTGHYTVNFTTAMSDANYSEIVGSGLTSVAPRVDATRAFCTGNRLSTSITVVVADNNVDTPYDMEVVNVSIFR